MEYAVDIDFVDQLQVQIALNQLVNLYILLLLASVWSMIEFVLMYLQLVK